MATAANVQKNININPSKEQIDVFDRIFAGKPIDDDEWKVIAPITNALGLHRATSGPWGCLKEILGISDFQRAFSVRGINNRIGGALSGTLKMGVAGYGSWIGGRWIYNKITK